MILPNIALKGSTISRNSLFLNILAPNSTTFLIIRKNVRIGMTTGGTTRVRKIAAKNTSMAGIVLNEIDEFFILSIKINHPIDENIC